MASTHPHPSPDSRQDGPSGVVVPVSLGVLGLIVGLVIVAVATSDWDLLAALGILLGVLVIGLGVAGLLARNAVTHDEARLEASGPAGASGAAEAQLGMMGRFFAGQDDDDAPLGDTSEAHDEITAHDLPLDHPGRAEAERQAEAHGGVTRGDDAR